MQRIRAGLAPACGSEVLGRQSFHVLFSIVLLCFLVALPGRSQSLWRGRVEIEVTVTAGKRAEVEGAKVTFLFLEVRPVAGPAPVETDSKGKARVAGLAEGRWHVEVVSEGYRSYLASVRVRMGKKVEVLSSAVLSEDGAGKAMTVSFSRARKGRSSIIIAPVPQVPRQPEPAPPKAPVAIEKPVETPAPPPSSEPVKTTVPETRVPSVVVPEPSAVASEQSAEPSIPPPDPVAAQPDRQEPPKASDPPPEPAAPEPIPEPQSLEAEERQPTVAAAPVPPLPKGPKQAARARSGRACPECPPGEQAVSVMASVAASGTSGSCPDDLDSRVREALELAAGDGVESFFGPLLDSATRDLADVLTEASGLRLRELLAGVSGTDPSCRMLAVVLPRAFRYSGYRYEAQDVSGVGDCPPSDVCQIGSCQWLGNPRIARRGELQVIYGAFTNRSPDRVRQPKFTVYFER